jgi:putative RecB family exonuclease
MGLSDLRKEAHLSVSGVNDYVDCGMHYRLSRIDKLQPEYKSDAMEFGSVIHVVLALFYEQKMAGNTLSAKELHGLFEKHWRKTAENRDDIQYAEGKTIETYILEGKELLTTFYHKAPHDQFEVMATEESFSFNIQGCPVPVIGAIDLLETDENGMLIITDFKTSSRAYSASEVDRNFQLNVYQMAMRRNGYSDREILLRFDCLIKTKTPKYEQCSVSKESGQMRG